MAYQDILPKRVRALILGGGIHGVGVFHDLISRGWDDVHLVEKLTLASGTSSRSTKLIHGGLRYLRHLGQVRLVSESLRERKLLLTLAPDIVEPIELLVPIVKGSLSTSVTTKAGLVLYDLVANKNLIKIHQKLSQEQVINKASILDQELFSGIYSFWDAQTDDQALVERVAASARSHGGGITERCEVLSVAKSDDGWLVKVRDSEGHVGCISTLYIINCLGPWAQQLLLRSEIEPSVKGFNNKGVHLLLEDLGLKAGLFLPVRGEPGRFIFMLPWKGYTLIGTTEEMFEGDPDDVCVTESDISYLLDECNFYLTDKLRRELVISSFAGLRWLADRGGGQGITNVSREHTLSEHKSKRGLMLTIYGGKLTSYRSLSEKIGDRITNHYGEFLPSCTKDKKYWDADGLHL